jgi:hypothetical protein
MLSSMVISRSPALTSLRDDRVIGFIVDSLIVLELFEVGFVDVDLAGVLLGCVDIDADVVCFGVVLFKAIVSRLQGPRLQGSCSRRGSVGCTPQDRWSCRLGSFGLDLPHRRLMDRSLLEQVLLKLLLMLVAAVGLVS